MELSAWHVRRRSKLLTPEEVNGHLERYWAGEDRMAMWAKRWPRVTLWWCCRSGCGNVLLSPGRCEEHGGGRAAMDLDSSGHLVIWIGRQYVSYQRLVVGCPAGKDTHHIDFNKWNNRLSNLAVLVPEEHRKIHQEHLPVLVRERAKMRRKAGRI